MKTSYRDIIQDILEERSSINPAYSMRSFARDLDISPSALSEVLSGKKGLSSKRALSIASGLRLPEWQQDLFCDLVSAEHAKSPIIQKQAKLRLKDKQQENKVHILNFNAMKSLTSWVDLAILELTYLKEFQPSMKWIAKKLNTEEAIIKSSVIRLKDSSLLQVDEGSGKWIDASPLFSSTDNVPNESIRKFHQSVLLKGSKKLDDPDITSRTVKSVIFSLSKDNHTAAKKILDEAITKIVALADQSSQEREDVMCFSAQLFSLLEPSKDVQ